MLRKAFDAFAGADGSINTSMVRSILDMLDVKVTEKMLEEIIEEVDADGSGELEFEEFVILSSRFLVEEDAEAMQQELREAFRLYDKEGNGYITTAVLREILQELDDKITSEELDMMIEEIDSDGSGTVDFDEFMEEDLTQDQIGITSISCMMAVLRKAFEAFDPTHQGFISTDMIGSILELLDIKVTDSMLQDIIDEVDADGSGQLEFEEFVILASRFLVEEDEEAMQKELREAFRLYDKEGNGYITTDVLREILRELDDKITSEELDMMIEEIDSDGSGTVDFEEFMEVMTGGDD
ncbi:hypothetical protein B566_EDAN008800 [Ephemera danica]|nr:hypothetical protein B566_EDAN008800 [Ephemera danica]